ncbi:head completion/stabilization protein, partial [Acinetobacter baumannii]
MSGLIANGTFSNQDVVINSDPFFPSVSSNHIREVLRLDSSVTNQRLISAIEAAVIHVNEQLESLLSKAPTLEEITTKQVNGKSIA